MLEIRHTQFTRPKNWAAFIFPHPAQHYLTNSHKPHLSSHSLLTHSLHPPATTLTGDGDDGFTHSLSLLTLSSHSHPTLSSHFHLTNYFFQIFVGFKSVCFCFDLGIYLLLQFFLKFLNLFACIFFVYSI